MISIFTTLNISRDYNWANNNSPNNIGSNKIRPYYNWPNNTCPNHYWANNYSPYYYRPNNMGPVNNILFQEGLRPFLKEYSSWACISWPPPISPHTYLHLLFFISGNCPYKACICYYFRPNSVLGPIPAPLFHYFYIFLTNVGGFAPKPPYVRRCYSLFFFFIYNLLGLRPRPHSATHQQVGSFCLVVSFPWFYIFF